jgi:hypothetical protein
MRRKIATPLQFLHIFNNYLEKRFHAAKYQQVTPCHAKKLGVTPSASPGCLDAQPIVGGEAAGELSGEGLFRTVATDEGIAAGRPTRSASHPPGRMLPARAEHSNGSRLK